MRIIVRDRYGVPTHRRCQPRRSERHPRSRPLAPPQEPLSEAVEKVLEPNACHAFQSCLSRRPGRKNPHKDPTNPNYQGRWPTTRVGAGGKATVTSAGPSKSGICERSQIPDVGKIWAPFSSAGGAARCGGGRALALSLSIATQKRKRRRNRERRRTERFAQPRAPEYRVS